MRNPRRTFPLGPGDSIDDAAWLGGEVVDDWLEARQESEGNMATENDEPDDPDAATDDDPRDPDWWKGRQNYGTAGDSKESEEDDGEEEGDADSDVGSVEDHLGW
jgi:hypothetical protein